jgi:hypothetical protein
MNIGPCFFPAPRNLPLPVFLESSPSLSVRPSIRAFIEELARPHVVPQDSGRADEAAIDLNGKQRLKSKLAILSSDDVRAIE